MIHAKIHELKKVFTTHYSISRSVSEPHIKVSHKLLLFYAIECGLKVLLLKKIRGNTTEAFMLHSDLKDKLNGKNGHNIKYILNYLGYGHFFLPNLTCLNGDAASPSEYNQVWRYGIEVDYEKEKKIIQELLDIVDWINRRI
ncbi:hypothetical protein HPY31_21020 [Brevibacillus sp. HB1.3]|uniref:hypothetical protein n=1 Tax=Brevibacillus sp. HB1.3 TaxID=2738842 RepID=UPI001556197F|nr:hypothetical protein [Brevibacillus sp. HB1.3]NQF16368.1 hypothetical protein [Brevibacillus sp. HB1.3]